eukprot:scaffold17116_cov67-Phaeocystis_antarctica.AAC.3
MHSCEEYCAFGRAFGTERSCCRTMPPRPWIRSSVDAVAGAASGMYTASCNDRSICTQRSPLANTAPTRRSCWGGIGVASRGRVAYRGNNHKALTHTLRVVVVVFAGAFLLAGPFLRCAVIQAYLALHDLVACKQVARLEVRRVVEDDAALGAFVHLAHLKGHLLQSSSQSRQSVSLRKAHLLLEVAERDDLSLVDHLPLLALGRAARHAHQRVHRHLAARHLAAGDVRPLLHPLLALARLERQLEDLRHLGWGLGLGLGFRVRLRLRVRDLLHLERPSRQLLAPRRDGGLEHVLGRVDQLVDDLVRVQRHLRPLGGDGELVGGLQVVAEHRRPQLLGELDVSLAQGTDASAHVGELHNVLGEVREPLLHRLQRTWLGLGLGLGVLCTLRVGLEQKGHELGTLARPPHALARQEAVLHVPPLLTVLAHLARARLRADHQEFVTRARQLAEAAHPHGRRGPRVLDRLARLALQHLQPAQRGGCNPVHHTQGCSLTRPRLEACHEVITRPQLTAPHQHRREYAEPLLHLCLEDHALRRARLSRARLARVSGRPVSGTLSASPGLKPCVCGIRPRTRRLPQRVQVEVRRGGGGDHGDVAAQLLGVQPVGQQLLLHLRQPLGVAVPVHLVGARARVRTRARAEVRARAGAGAMVRPRARAVVGLGLWLGMRRSRAAGAAAATLLAATMIGTPISLASSMAWTVVGCTPASSATMSSTMSVATVPRCRIAEKNSCPGVSMKVAAWLEPPSTWKAEMVCVMPPASAAASALPRKASSIDVLPWSTCPISVTTGGRTGSLASCSGGSSGLRLASLSSLSNCSATPLSRPISSMTSADSTLSLRTRSSDSALACSSSSNSGIFTSRASRSAVHPSGTKTRFAVLLLARVRRHGQVGACRATSRAGAAPEPRRAARDVRRRMSRRVLQGRQLQRTSA